MRQTEQTELVLELDRARRALARAGAAMQRAGRHDLAAHGRTGDRIIGRVMRGVAGVRVEADLVIVPLRCIDPECPLPIAHAHPLTADGIDLGAGLLR